MGGRLLKAYGAFVLVCGIFAFLVGLSGHFDWQGRFVCAVCGFEVARCVLAERRALPLDQRGNEALAHLLFLFVAGVPVVAALIGPTILEGTKGFVFRVAFALCGFTAAYSGVRELVR